MASAQALTPAVGTSSPVANATTSAKNFASNYAKMFTLTPDQRSAIRVVGLMHELKQAGGTDYTAATKHAQLIADATVWTQGISNPDRDVCYAVNEWANGYSVDNAVTTDIAAIILEGKDFVKLSDQQITRILAYLRSQLLE